MQTGKKILAAMLVFVMIMSVIPVFASAETASSFPQGTFFVHNETGFTFVDKTTWQNGDSGYWKVGGQGGWQPKTNAALDGPFIIFTVPETGWYDVWAAKRDRSDTVDRSITIDVSGAQMTFEKDNCPVDGNTDTVPVYYWQSAANDAKVYLTKGQQAVLRMTEETSTNMGSGVLGFAFVPRTGDTRVAVAPYAELAEDKTAVTANKTIIDNMAVAPVTPAHNTVNVTVGTTQTTVTAGAAESYFPNIRKYDVTGNYLAQPTLLDALVQSDLLENLNAHFVENDVLHTAPINDKVTPINYDTSLASGNLWNCGTCMNTNGATITNGAAGKIWPANQVFFGGPKMASKTDNDVYEMDVTVPQDGNYYLIGRGYGSTDTRYLIVRYRTKGASAPGTAFRYADNSAKFLPTTSSMTDFACDKAVSLTQGTYTIRIEPTGGIMRIEYLALVKTDTAADALALSKSFTTKEEFNNYFFPNQGISYVNGQFENMEGVITVNDIPVYGDYDQYILQENDVVKYVTTPEIYNLGGKITASGKVATADDAWTDAVTDGVRKFHVDNYANYEWQEDIATTNALQGWYFNGYIQYNVDNPVDSGADSVPIDTAGDDSQARIYLHNVPVVSSAIRNSATLQLAHDLGPVRVTIGDKEYIQGVPEDKTVTAANTDFSKLYITKKALAETPAVYAIETASGFILRAKATMPVTITTVTKDANGNAANIVTEKVTLNFTDTGYGVSCAPNQTIYVWAGTPLVTDGTYMKPLLAPLSK